MLTVDEPVVVLNLMTPAVGVHKLVFSDDAEEEMLFRLACTAL